MHPFTLFPLGEIVKEEAQSWAAMGISEAIRAGATNQPAVPSSLRNRLDCLSSSLKVMKFRVSVGRALWLNSGLSGQSMMLLPTVVGGSATLGCVKYR